MAYNADDQKQVKKARKDAAQQEAMRLDVIRGVMQTAAGRIWIYGFLDRCHCFATSFVQGAPDSSAFREGERNIGLQLLADVQSSAPDLYLLMIREAKDTAS